MVCKQAGAGCFDVPPAFCGVFGDPWGTPRLSLSPGPACCYSEFKMRGARGILLAAILGAVVAVGVLYRLQKQAADTAAPRPLDPLSADIQGKASDWELTKSDRGRPIVNIRARSFQQSKDGSKVLLEGVRLRLYHPDRDTFDYVESAKAEFSPDEQKLFSDGEVNITLGVPPEGEPQRQLVSIKTSGVSFDSASGKATTDRLAEFVFAKGSGKAMGATYDPATHELEMKSAVELNLAPPGAKPMTLEGGNLKYREGDKKILVTPWARLKRQSSVIESEQAIVTLIDGVVQLVEAQKAKGTDRYPRRQLAYSADALTVNFSAAGVVEKVRGEAHARLVSTMPQSVTTVTSDRVDLEFVEAHGESTLTKAVGFGHSVMESKPVPAPGRKPAATRVLSSDVIEIKMRPGGEEIESLETHSPGTLTFIPNAAGERRRELAGERLWMKYGPNNALESFRSVAVSTVTAPVKPGLPPMKTSSKHLQAMFDPKTGEMSRMEQWDDFRYAEGTKEATAAKATLESKQEVIVLETGARVWDPTGSTAADVIRLHQSSGNLEAEGRVTSSREPERKGRQSAMMSGKESVQATAARMKTFEGNQRILYEGGAVLWQGASRVKADTIEINRQEGRLVADGHVETQLVDRPEKEVARKTAAAVTTVTSAHLVYTDSDRLAHYTGNVDLIRPNMRVRGLELRAVLADPESDGDSRLERAFADGKVEIVQRVSGRTRTGIGERAEYEVSDEKITLSGGDPSLTDSLKGVTRGQELTYFSADDRLLVNGVPERPARTRFRRK